MDDVARVIDLIKRTPSYNDKQYLLKKNEHMKGLKEILYFIYNPYFKTGISTAKLAKVLHITDSVPMHYMELLKYLKAHNTGTDADLVVAIKFINSVSEESRFLAEAIVTQDLQIGVTAKTLNTVYGAHFIPTVGCMLGTKINNVQIDRVQWPCIVTEKLDGIRRILIKENGISRFYSRSGHEDTGLVDILEEAKELPDNRVYDGELLAIGYFKDSVALRQASNSIANLKGRKTGLSFNIFDMLAVEDFYKGASDESALTRKIMLGATFMDSSIEALDSEKWPKYIASFGIHKDLNFIQAVPILGYVQNMDQVAQLVQRVWRRGGEGVMLNTAASIYEVKRSKNLLKVKHTETRLLQVIDAVEGFNKYEGALGALIVEYKGNRVGVGSGFTDEMRHKIWNNFELYLGSYIEVETFGESTNMLGLKSLNCPIFKRFKGDE